MTTKPLARKAYGSIPHLPGSKRGSGDYGLSDSQASIMTHQPRRGDTIIVTEKLDGSCVAIAKIDSRIIPLVRAGYPAHSSSHWCHWQFNKWVLRDAPRWDTLLKDGERLVGEWLGQAHGTMYELGDKEPFFAFDLMMDDRRLSMSTFWDRFHSVQTTPLVAYSCEDGLPIQYCWKQMTETFAKERIGPPEGLVYRVEYNGKCEFLAKYVRADFEPGKYLDNDIKLWDFDS
ncbi:MAG: RNA ligase family protein [Verrucomicrobiota bacterium]